MTADGVMGDVRLKVKHVCTHPMMRPTQWNQPRLEPTEYYGCEHTAICPTCGYGFGCIPDPCDPPPSVFRGYLKCTVNGEPLESVETLNWRWPPHG